MTKKQMIDIATQRWTAVLMRVAELRQRMWLDGEIVAEYQRACKIKIRWYNLLIRLLK